MKGNTMKPIKNENVRGRAKNQIKNKWSPDIKASSKVKENFNNPCELRGFCHCFVQHGGPWEKTK